MSKKKIKELIEEGKEIQKNENFINYDSWKRKVQFFVEKIGTPSMKKEIEKELNKKPFWVATFNTTKEELEKQFKDHKKTQLKNLLSILDAIEDQGEFDDSYFEFDIK